MPPRIHFALEDIRARKWSESHLKARIGTKSRAWCAEILGISPEGKFLKRFIPHNTGYHKANSQGTRGVHKHFFLKPGVIYEISSPLSWTRIDRYFVRFDEKGYGHRITPKEVMLQCAKANP